MARLGAAVDYDPFEEPSSGFKLGAPVDFDPFGPPDEKPLELPPLSGKAAEGIPLPPIPERAPPLPEPRPLDLVQQAQADESAKINEAQNISAWERTKAALGDIPESVLRGYYGAKQGVNILGLETGQLTPEEAAANIAGNVAAAKENAMPESVRKGFEEYDKAKGFMQAAKAAYENPDVIPSLIGESIASSLVTTGTGLLGALTGAVAGSVLPGLGTAAGATAGLAAGTGAGSAATEYASSLNDFLTSKGYDTSDPEQLKAAFSNPELMAAARKDAAISGVAVGAFDALTAGIAGKLFSPVKKALGKGAVGAVAGTAAEIGAQAAGGAGGEATKQLGTKGEITSPGNVLLEAVGEIVPGLGEVAVSKVTGASPSPKAEVAPEVAPEAPAAPPSPEQPVEAPGAEQAPPPEAAPEAAPAPIAEAGPTFIPADDDIAILKGAGYDVEAILGMSPAEVKAEVRDAREAQIAPVDLTPEDRTLIEERKPATLGEPVNVPVEELIPQEAPVPAPAPAPVAPAPRAVELVEQGATPLEAIKEAGSAPIEPVPVAPAPVAAAEPIPAAGPAPAPEPVVEAAPEPEIQAAPIEPAAAVPRVEVNLPFALKGGETEVKVGDTYLPARYAVVDAENLKATLGKAVNQFRDRERMGSKGQIEKIANAPDWNQLNAAPVMDFGSPTLDRNGLIVGGNGRFEGLSRAYDRGTANNYRRLLQKNAGQFGVDPATFVKMKKPVLMRIIEADVDTGKLALASNEGAGLRMSMLEQAKVDSERLPDLGILRVGDNGEISAAGNRDLIKSWTKEMPATEIGGIVDAQGALSQEGLVRLRNAVMHKAYGDSPTLGRIIESLDQGSKNIAAALVRSAPRSARAKELIASGDLYNLDLTNDILDAAEKFEQLRNEGQKIKDYLNQGQMFGSDISPESRKILQFFGDHMRSAKSMSELFNKYLDKVEAVGNPKQAGMFGEEAVPTKGELLDAALQDTRKVVPAAEAELPFGEAAPAPAAEAPRVEKNIPSEEILPPVDKSNLQSTKIGQILGGLIRNEHDIKTRKTSTGYDLYFNGENIGSIKGEITQQKVSKELLQNLLNAYKNEGRVMPRDPRDMTFDEFTIAQELNKIIPQFEVNLPDFEKTVKVNSDGTFSIDYRGLYNKLKEGKELPAPAPKEKPAPAPAQQEKPGKIPGTELYIEAISSKDLPENLRPDLKRSLLERYFRPGAIVPSYGGKDRVVKLNIDKDVYDWSVEVKEVFDDGTVGRLRRHSSFPDPSEFRKLLGKDYDNFYVIRGDLDNNKKILDDLGFKPVRTVKGVKQRIFIGENPTEKIKEYAASGEIKKAPEAKKVISSVSEAETGKPFETTLYRGEPKAGETKPEFAYPILGGARYTTPNKDYAKSYGSDIKEIKVSLKNPLVIDNDTQWRNLTKSAGWKFPNLFGRPNDEIIKNVEDLKKIILSQGHDGVIVHIPKYKGFADESVAKTLANVFDEDTVVEYKVPKAAENVAPVAEAPPPAPAKEPSKSAKSHNSLKDFMAAKEQFSKSPNMPQEYLDVLADWATMLGMKNKIYLILDKDWKNFDFGKHKKPIRSIKGSAGLHTWVGREKAHVITLTIHPRKSYNLETVAHELGHAFEKAIWENSSQEEKDAVLADYRKFLKENKTKNIEDYIKALRAHVSGKLTNISPSFRKAPSKELKPYWRSFSEYFADQVSKYMMSEERPQTIVGKYFARIADGLKRLYNSLAGMQGKARKSMKEYIDRRVNEADNILDSVDSSAMEAEVGEEPVTNESRSTLSQDTIDEINELNKQTGMPQSVAPEQPKAPEETNFDKLRAIVQDDKTFVEKIVKHIEKIRNAPLPDSLNVYARLMLMPGRISERIHDLNQREIKPFFEKMKELKVTPDELHKYRLALHAKERNARMAAVNPEAFGKDGGSGLTNEAADILLERAKPREKELNILNEMLTGILDRDLKRRVEAGLISQEQADGYKAMYENYVPLRGFAERDFDEDFAYQKYNLGKGVSLSKEEYKKAMGRKSLSDNVVFNALMQAEEGIYRIEKNRAGKTLYNFARQFSFPDLWRVGKVGTTREIGADGLVKNVIKEGVNPDRIIVKIGGQPYYVDLIHPALKAAFGRTGAVTMARWFRPIALLTRGFSQMLTSKNPAFMATNFNRDLAEALFYTSGHDAELSAKVVKNLPKMLAIATKNSFSELTPEERVLFDNFRRSGAKISFNAISDTEGHNREWEKYVPLTAPNEWRKLPETTKKAAAKAFYKVVDSLEKMTQPFEDSIRASVFMSARQIMKPAWYKLTKEQRAELNKPENADKKEAYHKYSVDKSARFAQEATINFYRKGKWSPYLNGLYAFFNASTQGAATGLRLLKDSKTARLTFMSMVPLSFMLTLRNLELSDDDPMQKGRKNYNNIAEWQRENSIIIKTGKGQKDYFRIRLPAILTVPWYLGEQAALVMTGQQKATKAVGNVLGNAINAFNPFGSNSIVGAISPTLLDPYADILVNKKFSGAPIHPKPEPWNQGIPNSDQAFSTTAPWASTLTKTVYKATNGVVDIYPGDAEHVISWMFSGLGKNAGNVVTFMNDIRQGKDAKIENLPIIKSFAPTTWSPSARYYELHDAVDSKVNVLRDKAKDLVKSPSPAKYKEFNALAAGTGIYFDGEKANTSGADVLKTVRNTDSLLKQLRLQSITVQNNDKLTPKAKQKQLDNIKLQMERAMVAAGQQMSIFDPRPSFAPLSSWINKK